MNICRSSTGFHGTIGSVFGRSSEVRDVRRLLATNPVVAILGPRQVGKTTLARALARRWNGRTTTFDLEDPRDLERLADPSTALRPLRGLVVIDEIQRRPDLFPVLRVLADQDRRPARFLVLGSASPGLLKQSSESLAGRIAYFELQGFGLGDVGARWDRLWLRGGFPRSYLARSDDESLRWRRDLIRTFLERDLPELGITIAARTIYRFWMMLAHYHGQVWNGAELARAFGIAETTVKRYLDLLTNTFMVRVLPPWSENLGKRVVKTPKVYLADTGLLHALLDIPNARAPRRPSQDRRLVRGIRFAGGRARAPCPPRAVLLLGDPPGRGAGPARGRRDSAARIRVQAHRCAGRHQVHEDRHRGSRPGHDRRRPRRSQHVSPVGRDPGSRCLAAHDGPRPTPTRPLTMTLSRDDAFFVPDGAGFVATPLTRTLEPRPPARRPAGRRSWPAPSNGSRPRDLRSRSPG